MKVFRMPCLALRGSAPRDSKGRAGNRANERSRHSRTYRIAGSTPDRPFARRMGVNLSDAKPLRGHGTKTNDRRQPRDERRDGVVLFGYALRVASFCCRASILMPEKGDHHNRAILATH